LVSQAVALVLGFIGVKMLLGFADVELPTDLSLLVVGLVLGGGVGASLLLPEPADSD
jgi:predicted tellurium resistance membrane protein TerC